MHCSRILCIVGSAGPRFDSTGNIMPHSILGSVEAFKVEAVKRGHMEVGIFSSLSPTNKKLCIPMRTLHGWYSG